MFSKSGKEKCNVVVIFKVLEADLSGHKDKSSWLSLVLKRGKQERFETPYKF